MIETTNQIYWWFTLWFSNLALKDPPILGMFFPVKTSVLWILQLAMCKLQAANQISIIILVIFHSWHYYPIIIHIKKKTNIIIPFKPLNQYYSYPSTNINIKPPSLFWHPHHGWENPESLSLGAHAKGSCRWQRDFQSLSKPAFGVSCQIRYIQDGSPKISKLPYK